MVHTDRIGHLTRTDIQRVVFTELARRFPTLSTIPESAINGITDALLTAGQQARTEALSDPY